MASRRESENTHLPEVLNASVELVGNSAIILWCDW